MTQSLSVRGHATTLGPNAPSAVVAPIAAARPSTWPGSNALRALVAVCGDVSTLHNPLLQHNEPTEACFEQTVLQTTGLLVAQIACRFDGCG